MAIESVSGQLAFHLTLEVGGRTLSQCLDAHPSGFDLVMTFSGLIEPRVVRDTFLGPWAKCFTGVNQDPSVLL